MPQCKRADITVSPPRLKFEVTEGWQFVPPYQYLQVAKDGTGMPPPWAAIWDVPWLSVSPVMGETPDKVRIGCYSIGMAAGIYQGHVTIPPHVITVVLTIYPKSDPIPIPEPDTIPPEYDFPSEEAEIIPEATPKPKPQPIPESVPEAESRFMKLIRWILKLLRGINEWA